MDIIAASVGMVGVGSAAIIKSGVFRKKKTIVNKFKGAL